ncbi:hypothetical protein HETIRDRAFT_460444 [Heterobasidion irregulare TC 32-1]|uniref:Uncharacterized protein n=1 Tax=Heterobasidion irregulare (strain TC 32-1) TaxID=747525 RepID=W4JXS8_HETIT|nr:uncharacterized protein HETIRDRAFT_460444 [Heterobasidion irregulare TC 32-1]ETW78333.1 hypothetical protein HETIRDRAFT_460444 [Heterobasidion irregulare TC 32-1]
MSYHGYQSRTGHYEPYPPHSDQWATHPGTYGLQSRDYACGHPQPVAHDMNPYAPSVQHGESAWSGAPLAIIGYEARRYGHPQHAGVATTPIYGADPYAPYETAAHHVEAIHSNTSKFNNGDSVERSTAAQPFAEGVLASVAGPSTLRMPPVPALSTTAQAPKSKVRMLKRKTAGGANGTSQVNAKAQILGKAVAKKKRTMPPEDGPWVCRVEGQIYARYWEMLQHQETTEGHDEYQGPCICVSGRSSLAEMA